MVDRGKRHFGHKSRIKPLRMRIKSAKVQKKCFLRLKWLKIDGCMHPLLKIDGCSCTRYYEGADGDVKLGIIEFQLINHTHS